MNNYSCLNNQIFEYENYRIEPYRFQDLSKIKEWRNQQIDVLRQKKILSDEDQLNYYYQYIEPSFSKSTPTIILFSYLYDNELIGYGGLTNCSWEDKRSELSFLVATERFINQEIYENDFSTFIRLMKQVNFDELGFNRLFTETYDIRPYHIAIMEKNGFQFEGRMKQHLKIDGKYVDALLHGILKENNESV